MSLEEGIWHNVDGKIVVPNSSDIRLKLISDFHDSPYAGHVGINKTTRLVSRYYWWPNMGDDITNYVRECHSCQTVKARQQKLLGLLRPLVAYGTMGVYQLGLYHSIASNSPRL